MQSLSPSNFLLAIANVRYTTTKQPNRIEHIERSRHLEDAWKREHLRQSSFPRDERDEKSHLRPFRNALISLATSLDGSLNNYKIREYAFARLPRDTSKTSSLGTPFEVKELRKETRIRQSWRGFETTPTIMLRIDLFVVLEILFPGSSSDIYSLLLILLVIIGRKIRGFVARLL